jgi:hypothetical protein
VNNVCRENIRDTGVRNLASATKMHYNVFNCTRLDVALIVAKYLLFDTTCNRNAIHNTSNCDFIIQL